MPTMLNALSAPSGLDPLPSSIERVAEDKLLSDHQALDEVLQGSLVLALRRQHLADGHQHVGQIVLILQVAHVAVGESLPARQNLLEDLQLLRRANDAK